MRKSNILKSALAGGVSAIALSASAFAANFNIPGGDLETALNAYSMQAVIPLIVSDEAIKGARTKGAKGELTATAALSRILEGTGFSPHRTPTGAIAVVHDEPSQRVNELMPTTPVRVAAAAAAGIESVVVTSSKIKGDIQTVPIAITALSQEQLTSRQIAGGPDLVKEVPNLTFSKTNFSGYTIQIRGIGTQAISVTTDPAVAVALNDIPFIRNHFFEQEFFDVNQVEVLRGPQGTLYGRNATAGVVNVISAKPTDQFEAMASADFGNYHNRRFEGMVNIPVVDDRADLRIAGEWTKRNGYSTNALTSSPIDGRDLWSTRVTLAIKPSEKLQAWVVWEHCQESDDRLRTSKQLCKTAPIPTNINGAYVPPPSPPLGYSGAIYLSQSCLPVSLYDKGDPAHGDYGAFGVPNGYTLPYYEPLGFEGVPITAEFNAFDPYANQSQSTHLRVIETTVPPIYKAKNDTIELNADYSVAPDLTFTSQTGYNHDFLWSTEDYNRFNTRPGAFTVDDSGRNTTTAEPNLGVYYDSGKNCTTPGSFTPGEGYCSPIGIFCDPQLGCSDRLVAQDLNDEKAWQLSQEFRLASNFSGPLNFSIGGNFLHYETEENYYVFINSLTMAIYTSVHSGVVSADSDQTQPWVAGVSDNSNCMAGGLEPPNPNIPSHTGVEGQIPCGYIDPNPLSHLNNEGHNYFLSQNPYTLNSYAGFGEVYYNVANDLKLTGGLRFTDDQKHFLDIPSQLLTGGYGYSVTRIVDQKWNELTGRLATNWTPKLDFTDQTLVYGSYAHGYKAGGANPPGATLLEFNNTGISDPIHPLTFKPEFVDAYELGTKNTAFDGGLTLNGDVFFYNYKAYQISRIVDRTSINDNFDATVRGAEVEAMWEPTPGLKFNFAGDYEDTRIDNGQSSIDLMDRADLAEHPDWMVVKPFVTQASNCILPVYVMAALVTVAPPTGTGYGVRTVPGACSTAYQYGLDPVTYNTYKANPKFPDDYIDGAAGSLYDPGPYPGWDPATAPNHGEGWAKNLGGNELPNAPHFTTSLSADYTMPVSEDWAATAHTDLYWQSQSWARVFNDRPYDKIRGYSNVNLALILTSASGWQAMGYLKNVFNTTTITGDFLNSDDSGLTTNVFLTDPRLFGVRVTKNW
ncbi:MAG TPA: TonB-dependent receptor [Rhizomicrobium sp.]|nr:TonB-dependent receptor [Rhizomicrobium sp.]